MIIIILNPCGETHIQAHARRQATMSKPDLAKFTQLRVREPREVREEGSAGRETQEVRRSLGHRGRKKKCQNLAPPRTVNAAVTRAVIIIPSQVVRRADLRGSY